MGDIWDPDALKYKTTFLTSWPTPALNFLPLNNRNSNGKSFLNINLIMSTSHDFLFDQKITFKNPFFSQQGMDGLVTTCPQNLISYFLSLYSSHSSHIEFLSIHCRPLAPSHHRAFEHAVSSIMNTFPFPSSTTWLLHKSQLKHHLLRKALHDLPD